MNACLGAGISIQGLFLIPLLMGAFYFDRIFVYINTLFISIVATMSFRVSVFPGQMFSFFLTFAPMLVGFGVTSQFILMLITLIRALLEHVEHLDQECNELKISHLKVQKKDADF